MESSTKNRWVRAVASALTCLQLGLVGGGLLFRGTLYHRLPVAPGEPYGLGDIIELLIYFTLIGTSLCTLLAALVCCARPVWRDRVGVAVLLGAALLPLPAYYVLHASVTRLGQ
jgi:hypothetical protein